MGKKRIIKSCEDFVASLETGKNTFREYTLKGKYNLYVLDITLTIKEDAAVVEKATMVGIDDKGNCIPDKTMVGEEVTDFFKPKVTNGKLVKF